MIEVMIERWTNPDGSTDHLWSLWRDGSRLHFGDKHETALAAEAEAVAFCQRTLGVEPNRVTRL
jgi:hypothetical protein